MKRGSIAALVAGLAVTAVAGGFVGARLAAPEPDRGEVVVRTVSDEGVEQTAPAEPTVTATSIPLPTRTPAAKPTSGRTTVTEQDTTSSSDETEPVPTPTRRTTGTGTADIQPDPLPTPFPQLRRCYDGQGAEIPCTR
ncbi:hypothetical protein GA0070616_4354 [Micromonospora nigra]|uniref:Uncharacterized protein n=1 Tax=Micromonospora nigra TaxID=145857 RepID=A0A1C6SRC2_9ACTN|nr:hypothetical protein [Micromonospora nigra]SCL31902.1 hypothetical protein GA0070616_4354 [Micromonospora nigra]